MIASQNMVAEADIVNQVLDVPFRLRVSDDRIDLPPPPPSSSVSSSSANDSVSVEEPTPFESGLSCSDNLTGVVMEPPKLIDFVPCMRSGSYADIGSRKSMDDEHIRIDDLSPYLGSLFKFCTPIAFYAVFDGHGGPEAARYIKENAMKLFFGESVLPKTSEVDDTFLKELESSHRQAFLLADRALADEGSISSSCGTTALTALVVGRHLVIANAGDCRAVLCKRGVAVELSHDHRPSYQPERIRVEGLGGSIHDGYLDGLSVTRALGDWEMKLPLGRASPLTAEPEIQQVILSEEDEFLIIACDGIWDVMPSQNAVSLVRRRLRQHNDPQLCAKELVKDALLLHASDNLTVIVVCFSAGRSPQRPRVGCGNLTEEGRNTLRSLLGGN